MPLMTFNFNSAWKFKHNNEEKIEAVDYDDSDWRQLDLPHDWSIEHEFDQNAPTYCRGAWLASGHGAYRKHFRLPADLRGKKISVLFDGAYRNAEIFLNGHMVGSRPWGYITFEFDLSEFINYDEENILAVKLDNQIQPASRWYTGCGIYRDVRLLVREEFYIPTWGVQIKTPEISDDYAKIVMNVKIKNSSVRRTKLFVVSVINDASGKEIFRVRKLHTIGAGLLVEISDNIKLNSPELWDINNPALYTLKNELYHNENRVDTVKTRFGIREMQYDAQSGFILNGRQLKLKGVCLHNDGGAIGAACAKTTFERQLKLLKDMGCNAIRTAHHPFSKIFLDTCDELGILVLAEAFDEWQEAISVCPSSDGEPQRMNVHYYSDIFDKWADQDLKDMILRDRNHPSIFMWCIGNEIPQMHKNSGKAIAEHLSELVHNLDDRPVTCSVVAGGISGHISDRNFEALDIVGLNYPNAKVLDDQKSIFPERKIIVTEHHAAQPLIPRMEIREPELDYTYSKSSEHVSAHMDAKPGKTAWEIIAERDFVMGIFIWTGWDYLGEITPYDWPAHNSFFGIVDLCGFPKSGYYYYSSQWKKEPMVYIDSHWNWPEETISKVKIISNCDQVELFLNGRSLGKKSADMDFSWEVPFEAGELKAVGIQKNSKSVEHTAKTASKANRLRLTLYSDTVICGEGELAYVTCEILDSNNVLVPLADDWIQFKLSGPASLCALDNGNPFDTVAFKSEKRRAFNGKCLAIVKADNSPGIIEISAYSEGLLSDSIKITSKINNRSLAKI